MGRAGMTVDPFVGLVRRWAVDWLAAADPSVCPAILAPAYNLLIGGFTLGPRDTYIEGTLAQLGRFPGLGVTIHELIASPDGVALRFTEHGADTRKGGQPAAWGGVALFASDGQKLSRGWAEEDYLSRRRQLADGVCDPIEAPAAAPWNTAPQPADPAAEAVVRGWLEQGDLSAVERDDSWMGRAVAPHLDQEAVELTALFSAGTAVAFHGLQRGRYMGGLDDLGAAVGAPAQLHLAGLVHVEGDEVVRGRVVRDRLGLRRALGIGAS